METRNNSRSVIEEEKHWFWLAWEYFTFFAQVATAIALIAYFQSEWNPFSFGQVLLVANSWNIFIFLAIAEFVNLCQSFTENFIKSQNAYRGGLKSFSDALFNLETSSHLCSFAGSCFALAFIFSGFASAYVAPALFTLFFALKTRILFLELQQKAKELATHQDNNHASEDHFFRKWSLRMAGTIAGYIAVAAVIISAFIPQIYLAVGILIVFAAICYFTITYAKKIIDQAIHAGNKNAESAREREAEQQTASTLVPQTHLDLEPQQNNENSFDQQRAGARSAGSSPLGSLNSLPSSAPEIGYSFLQNATPRNVETQPQPDQSTSQPSTSAIIISATNVNPSASVNTSQIPNTQQSSNSSSSTTITNPTNIALKPPPSDPHDSATSPAPTGILGQIGTKISGTIDTVTESGACTIQ